MTTTSAEWLGSHLLAPAGTDYPLNGAETDSDGVRRVEHDGAVAGSQALAAFPRGGTAGRRGGKPCIDCGKPSSGKRCRKCYLASIGSNQRKTDPEEQFRFLERMFLSAVRRAASEDPGLSLPKLMHLAGKLNELIDDAGVAAVRRYGTTAVAEEMTIATGEFWRPQRADKRWGKSSPAAQAPGREPWPGEAVPGA